MRANKLKTALSRDRLACLAPPDMFFLMYMHIMLHVTSGSPVYQVVMLWLMCFDCSVLICMCVIWPSQLSCLSSSVGRGIVTYGLKFRSGQGQKIYPHLKSMYHIPHFKITGFYLNRGCEYSSLTDLSHSLLGGDLVSLDGS